MTNKELRAEIVRLNRLLREAARVAALQIDKLTAADLRAQRLLKMLRRKR